MKTYELTYIISSQFGATEAEETANTIVAAIKNKDGVVLKSEKTAPQTLSYRIKGQSSGSFVTVEFQAAEDAVKELWDAARQDKRIIRSLVVVKKPVKITSKRRRAPVLSLKIDSASAPLSVPEVLDQQIPAQENPVKKKVDAETIEKRLDEILGE